MKSIISIILIAASISFFIFFTKPKWAELKANRIEVEKLNVAQENAKKLKERIKSLLDVKNAIKDEDLQKIKKMIPDNVENVKLIIDFDNMLQALVAERGTTNLYKTANSVDSEISIENPKITQGTALIEGGFDASQLGVADFSFTVSLTYDDFMEFLKRIETSTRIFDVESITFTTPAVVSGTSANEIVYAFNVALKTYWLKSK